ncbi:MAG: hypothetical protein ACJAYU_000461 [Bradymonadia bacterium]|jgi:hypothetical protein
MFNVRRLACSAGLLFALGASSGCSGTEDPEGNCSTGEFCECTVSADCPDPTVESCSSFVPGQPGICVAGGTGTDTDVVDDTADAADTDTGEEDTGQDVDIDTEDTTDVSDASDVSDDADTTEADADVEADAADADVETDAADTADADIETDTADGDTEADADVAVDTDPDADAGTIVRDPPYLGWVAYHVVGTASPVERIHLISGDGTLGPYTLPSAWEFGGTKYATFSPDGTHLAYSLASETGPAIRIVTLADGTFEDILNTGAYTSVRFPRWSPDGSQMLFLARTVENSRVWNIGVLDISEGTATMLTELTDGDSATSFVSAGAWNGDANKVLYITGVPGQGEPSDVWMMNTDGTGAEAVSAGANPTSLILSVRPDGSEALFDSAADGQPARIGIQNPAPSGGLAYGEIRLAGTSGDSSCAYYGNTDQAVCTRLQTPAFEACFEGGSDCTHDIVVIDLLSGDAVQNISRSPDARDGFAAVSMQPFTDISVSVVD